MATIQAVLNLMEVLHPELQLQSGEVDVDKGIIALNAAQDYMESVFALQPNFLGDSTGTISTVAQTEKTAFPSGVLRIDRLQYLDSTSGLPIYDLDDIRRAGGHASPVTFFPFVSTSSAVQGSPRAYYTDGRYVYWDPLPDGAYTIRWYGFSPATDISAASDTFAYPDICQLPLATFAVRLIRTGLDDETAPYVKLAADTFEPVVNVLSNFQRERAPDLLYRYSHDT